MNFTAAPPARRSATRAKTIAAFVDGTAGGCAGLNAALALLLTVLTNLIAVFSVPFVLGLVLDAADVTLSPLPMLAKLRRPSLLLPNSTWLGKTPCVQLASLQP